MDYVRIISEYIRNTFAPEDCAFMLTDLPEATVHPDHVINGYRPDVFVCGPNCIIIGEAKTNQDTKNRHTREQIRSYVEELKTYDKDKHLIVCTSLLALPELKNQIRQLHKEFDFSGVHIHCMNDLQMKTVVWDL